MAHTLVNNSGEKIWGGFKRVEGMEGYLRIGIELGECRMYMQGGRMDNYILEK